VIELANSAAQNGITAIALTDHGPAMKDGAPEVHFSNMRIIPPILNGVRVFRGVEANIVDFDGNIDLQPKCMDRLEWVIASFHEDVIQPGTIQQHTQAYKKLAENPYVDVIGHSGTACFPYDYEQLIPIFKIKRKIVEINNHSFIVRPTSRENCRRIALLCKKHEVPVTISSDAHIATEIGDYREVYEMLRSINFPETLIVNRTLHRLESWMEARRSQLKNGG
jgi:putative hydrolase